MKERYLLPVPFRFLGTNFVLQTFVNAFNQLLVFRCEVKCENSWGLNCKNSCSCKNGGNCDAVDGSCKCLDGYIGIL